MRLLQPLLHDLVPTLAAPTVALSGPDGQIRPSGVQGVFHADCRVLSAAVLRLDGHEPESIGHAPAGPGATRFVSVARWLGDEIADPTVRIVRTRRVRPGAVDEEIVVASTATVPVRTEVTIETAADLAPIEAVKSGVSNYVVKPFTGQTLAEKLAKIYANLGITVKKVS